MLNALKSFSIVSMLGLVAACGGGGTAAPAGPVAATDTFPLLTIVANSLQASSNSFTVSGTVSGVAVTGSGTATNGNISGGTFEGVAALQRTSTVTGTINGNGTATPLNGSHVSWFTSNYMPLGESGGDDYVVVNGAATVPTTVRVNDTGPVYTANRYSDSTKSIFRGTRTVTYVVEADTVSTAILTMIIVDKNTSNSVTFTGTAQLRITPVGTFTRIKETGVGSGTALTITY